MLRASATGPSRAASGAPAARARKCASSLYTTAALALLRKKARPRRRGRIRKLRLLALLSILGVLGLASFTFGLLTAVAAKIPQLDPSKQHTEANTYVYAANGHTVLAILRGSQARVVVPSSAISPWMKHAIVAIEDKRFYEHRGVDLRGMARAVWADVTHHGTVQGGSTITQQFVKQAYLNSHKSIGRKLIEAALAWQLERQWSKDKILTAYLNTVYFGNGAYGVEQASRVYFGHKASKLNPAEAALLAGIPQDPSLWDPLAHPQAAKDRRDVVLQQLLQQGYLTHGQYVAAHSYPMPKPQDISLPATQGQAAPFFANYVKDQLVRAYGPSHAYGGGLKVTTTLDPNLQRIGRQAVSSVLTDPNGPTAALVALDVHTGSVLAMVGGENYHHSQFNLATQGERQPGSAFKPFVLAAALRKGIAPSSVLESKPITIDAGGRLWPVSNYEGEYLGRIDLTQATAYSDNSVFSQLTAIVGPNAVRTTARLLGITTPLKAYFAIGLGAEPATPLEMARAYGSFADGGYRLDGSIFGNQPRVVEKVVDAKGHVQMNGVVPHQVLTNDQAATVDQLLQGVVRYGTGRAAALPDRQVAGKTGTTENYGDAWFVGYTPQLVAAVWVGYPDKLIPMQTEFHGHPVAGGTFPALIWKAFMSKALDYLKAQPETFPSPTSEYAGPVTVVNRGGVLERDDGVCRNTVQLAFYGGVAQLPMADCKPNEVEIPNVVGETLTAARARLDGQPLTPAIIYRPARPGERLDVVVKQLPARGTASAHDTVTLVLPKSLHGAIPQLVGLPLPRAQAKVAKLHLDVQVQGGTSGKVTHQSPRARTAAAPGLRLTLTVGGAKAG
ncbi:MAG TPA: PBP1A family penicillin-binding protein [Gaiellaceae bacterium]|nr:PBP1A family penicillin-binding protein [Gaiellaceae bacterium]